MSGTVVELFTGGTCLRLVEGWPLEHLTHGLYTGSNAKGVMGAGLPGDIRRLGGPEIERDLRARGPLSMGEAYLTEPGHLRERGVTAIAHGVVAAEPGAPATLRASIDALLAGLRVLEGAGCRSVTIPQTGWRVSGLDNQVAARELARVITTHLRRGSKLGLITIVGDHREYLTALAGALKQAGALEHDPGSGVEI